MKTLLLTTGLNNDKNSSWLVYAKYVRLLRMDLNADIDIICFTPSLKPSSKTLGEETLTTFFRDKIITAIANRISRKYSWWITNYYARIYSKRIAKYIRNNKFERLWVHTDLMTLLILERISKQIALPYHLTIYDDPFTNRFYNPFKERVTPVLKKLFLGAKSIDTPTMLLAEHYRKAGYLNENCQLSESLVGTFKQQVNEPNISENIRKIGLVGSIYGVDALNVFLKTMEDVFKIENIEFHLRTNVPKVYLKYLENNYPSISKNILIKPFLTENELPLKLQEYDLLYLPMMFDEKYRFKTNTSFPSKTHNYLASGVPIIVHTPVSSSLYRFFKNNEIGYIIDTLDKDVIREAFDQLKSKNLRQELSVKIQQFNRGHLENEHVKKLYNVIVS